LSSGWPFFFQRTCGSGCPRGGSHSNVAGSPRIPRVAKGTVRNSGCKSKKQNKMGAVNLLFQTKIKKIK
jgi:hypothetical protein